MTCHLRGGPNSNRNWNKRSEAAAPTKSRSVTSLASVAATRPPAISINDRIYSGLDALQAVAIVRDVLSGRSLPPEPRERLNVRNRLRSLRWIPQVTPSCAG